MTNCVNIVNQNAIVKVVNNQPRVYIAGVGPQGKPGSSGGNGRVVDASLAGYSVSMIAADGIVEAGIVRHSR